MTTQLEAEIPNFQIKVRETSKQHKFECKMVDNNWDQLVLGLGYQFLSFEAKKPKFRIQNLFLPMIKTSTVNLFFPKYPSATLIFIF